MKILLVKEKRNNREKMYLKMRRVKYLKRGGRNVIVGFRF